MRSRMLRRSLAVVCAVGVVAAPSAMACKGRSGGGGGGDRPTYTSPKPPDRHWNRDVKTPKTGDKPCPGKPPVVTPPPTDPPPVVDPPPVDPPPVDPPPAF